MTGILDPDRSSANPDVLAEYENEPVPAAARRSLASVAAVWVGFPMILTCAVFGGLVVYSQGFWRGMLAILLGNLVLFGYVGALSYVAGDTGRSFAQLAQRTFGRYGRIVPAAFLSTIVIGWFAFQTGLTGSIIHSTLGWNEAWTSVLAGIGYMLITLVGIRALSVIGIIAAPLYLVLAAVALIFALSSASLSSVFGYQGGSGALSFGACVTLVIACFADSGTMTSDFTRWSRNGREGLLAAAAAFPVANVIANVVGGVFVALGVTHDTAANGGNFLGILVDHGGWVVPIAIGFVFVNLGSVCAHCLYNGAIGWGQLTGRPMRMLTVVLGICGTILAGVGVWSHFDTWLNLLGVVVPPIGIVMILDLLVLPRFGVSRTESEWHLEPFLAWAGGAGCAMAAHLWAPGLSEAIVGMLSGALFFAALRLATRPEAVTA
ncbi:purine-cytosine permease family protein [Nocardia sp. NBC_01327]|uniref:purine-cytosine permease family protein n=1 Tax=Nocardia sp. NBC_01327 TaxID=2903593 RepID=UPI002E1652A2|nr:cytosine permease [Nocardia sp. NBC_01327]